MDNIVIVNKNFLSLITDMIYILRNHKQRKTRKKREKQYIQQTKKNNKKKREDKDREEKRRIEKATDRSAKRKKNAKKSKHSIFKYSENNKKVIYVYKNIILPCHLFDITLNHSPKDNE